MTEKQYIQFFDTTLRDGEQTPGVNFNTKEKVQIALQMEKWGIDVIEADRCRESSFAKRRKVPNCAALRG